MYRSFLLALLPLAALAQGNQQPSEDATMPPQPPGAVEGRVSNAQTGDGIGGASIKLIPVGKRGAAGTDRSTTSQSDGTFAIESVNPDTYFILATQSGFASSTRSGQARLPVDVEPGQVVSNISIQLSPIGRIRGRVVDEDGNPLAGVRVQAFSTYNIRGRTQLRRASETMTDEQGKYSLKTQAAGRYYVAAEPEIDPQEVETASGAKAQDPKVASTPQGFELVRTYYSQALDIESATALDISAGQDASDITIQLRRAAAYHVRGKVEGLAASGSERGPIISLGLRGTLASDGVGKIVRPQADGAFDIPQVVPGSYTLIMTGMDSTGASQGRRSRIRLLARQDIDVGASDVNGISLAIIPLVTLSGRLSIEGVDNSNLSGMRVSFTPTGSAAVGGFQTVAVQSDGTFAVQNLAPGEYGVQVMGTPSGTYVKSVLYNRQDVTGAGLDLTQGGGGEIDVVLRSGTGEVDGALPSTDQRPATAMMILVPEKPASDGSGTLLASVQSTGGFVSRNVPPGHYYAFAVERWSPLWQNPDFLRQIQNQGTSVDVPENGHVQVQLSIISVDQMQAAAIPLGLTAQ